MVEIWVVFKVFIQCNFGCDLNYWVGELKEGSQVQLHVLLTELGVISMEGRQQGEEEGNGRRGKKPVFEGAGQRMEVKGNDF